MIRDHTKTQNNLQYGGGLTQSQVSPMKKQGLVGGRGGRAQFFSVSA